MKNDVSKISVSVIVNHTEKTTTVKISGEKTPVSFMQSASQMEYPRPEILPLFYKVVERVHSVRNCKGE